MTHRRLYLVAVVVVGLAAAGVLTFPEIARRVVVRQLAAATGRPVTLAALELHPIEGRLALRDLRVMDRDQGALASIERIEARFSLRELLSAHLRVTDVTVDAPAVRLLRLGSGEFNVSDLLGRRDSRGPSALALTIERLTVRGGTVSIEDRTLSPPRLWRVDGMTLEALGVSTAADATPGVARFAAVAAGSPVSVWMSGVRLAPLRFHATAIAREIDATLAALYLPADSLLTPTRGTLDASATIEQDDSGRTRLGLEAVLTGIEMRRPGQDPSFLYAPAIKISVEDLAVGAAVELKRLAVDAGTVVLEDARSSPSRQWLAEDVAVEARDLSSARDAAPGVAVARAVVAGSPVSVWVSNVRLAPIALDATAIVRDVDLTLFRLYLPADLPVQPERGVLDASVRVEHDGARGTRLALDAGLSGVVLRRPAHVVTAPSLRVTAEDVAFGAGAVTVGHAALGGARVVIEERSAGPARTWLVQNLAVEASRLSSRSDEVQGVATARATVAGALVSAWITRVRLEPLELHATAIVRNLDLALAQLYLPPAVPVQLDRGAIDASLHVDHDARSGTRVSGDLRVAGAAVRGRGAAAGLAVSAPSLRLTLGEARRQGDALRVGPLEITGAVVLDTPGAPGGRLDLERLRLATDDLSWPIRGPARVEASARFRDGGELSASGTALLTAPLPALAWTTELAVQVKDVDVAPTAAYVPAASGIRGRVSAAIRGTIAYGASLTARLTGEATGTRLALRDGTQRLLAVRSVEATGLDAHWPERVGVGRLRLVRPRALVERDRHGAFPLLARFAAPAGSAGPAVPRPAEQPAPVVAAGEVAIEQGRLTFVDARDGAGARIVVPRIDATLRDARWPTSAPMRVRLDAALPAGGTATAEGTLLGERPSADLRVVLADADLSLLQPYLPFRANVRSRVDAAVVVTGPLTPAPRLTARGDATLRGFALADGPRPVLTVDRIAVTGIDAAWPERLALDRVRVAGSWALIERDRHGRFLLRELLQRTPGRAPAGPGSTGSADSQGTPATPPAAFELRVGEATVEDGAATIVDAITSPPARVNVAGARLAVQDLTWPPRGPVKLHLASPMPAGGRLEVRGTMSLEPVRLEARASLDAVEVEPAQPYLPIAGRVAGRVTGDLSITVALDPTSVKVAGDARLQRFRLSDGDRPVVSVGRAEAAGIDVDWPARVSVDRVRFRWPSLLVERDARGAFALRRLVTPDWDAGSTAAPGPAAAPSPSSPGPARPAIEVRTFTLERASGRFVDRTTAPPYAEQLSELNVTFTGFTTAPGGRTRFAGTGALGGGATFKVEGQSSEGEPRLVEVEVDVQDFPLPRANPYLEQFTGWTATRGTLRASTRYTLHGARLDAQQELVVRGLDVARAAEGDEVEGRLGLPLGFLVSLLKNARGEVHLSVPVSGDVSTREFDFREAVWGAARNVTIGLLALPFSRVGSIFFNEDSTLEALTLAPVVFAPGTAELVPAMSAHLDHVAAFLRAKPAVTVRVSPVLTQADLDALSGGAAGEVPPERLRDLGARRLDAIRQRLTAAGIAPDRLVGTARRTPLVEAAGAARVELDLRP